MNDRTRSVVALEVDVAATRAERRRGLLGRDSLSPTEGLLLAPCFAVHTVGMRFPIDVVFLDRDGKVVRVVPQLQPWRIAVSLRARAVVELSAGTAAASHIQVGDFLYLAPAPPPRKRTVPVKRDEPSKDEVPPVTRDIPLTNQVPFKPGVAVEEHPPC
jgi:uncharacterized membrane protein (UPF0127 family)